MTIEKKKVDTSEEKKIIIGCIVSTRFIRDLKQLIPDFSLLSSPHLKLIGSWCYDYYDKYGEAPKETIGDIFAANKKELKPEQIEFFDGLLEHLNDTYMGVEFNDEYFLTQAKKYIDERNILTFSEKIKGLATKGETERAYSEISDFKKIEKPMGSGIDILNDKDFVESLFEEPDEDLFKIPGDLGKAVQKKFRGDVIGIGARQKLGKTWMLMELAKYATQSGRNVCFYTLEMKSSIMGKRIFKSLSGSTDYDLGDAILHPYFAQDGVHRNKWEIKGDFKEFTALDIKKARTEQMLFKRRSNGGGFRLFDRSSGGATMEQIEYSLQNLEEYENYLCDVAIIDYDDIVEVKGPEGRDDRARLNHVWLYAKKIASERNILVILASQNGRQAFSKDAGVDDIAGDIRKFSHVSHWITLNQNYKEKQAKIMRVKVEGRHGDFNPLDEVVCLQNLAIGRPVIDSCLLRNITNYEEWIEYMNSDQGDLDG